MDHSQKTAHARMLFADPVFHEILGELEREAVNIAIYADITDHEKRAAAIGEVRAIRRLKDKIEALVESEDRPKPKAIA